MFTLNNPVKLVFGEDSLDELPEVATDIGKKALIVTGRSSARKYGILQKTSDLLSESGIESIPFEKVIPNPLSTTVEEGVEIVKKENCDLVVGLGGGSAMDTAKAIGLSAVNDGNITDYQPGGKYEEQEPEKSLPVITITTTAGTGSEFNRYLVITNVETDEKPGIGFECTYPEVSIVDPGLMVTVPEEITTDTGVDVLFHAIEAFVSKGSTMYSDMLAKEAIKLVVNNLETTISNGDNIEGRTKMAWANTLAGRAIDIAGTVAIHSSAHPLSGHYNLTHGQTLAALGVTYLQQNYKADPEKFAMVAKLLGYSKTDLSTTELAAKSPQALKNFLQKVDRDIQLEDLVDIDSEEIKKLAEDTVRTMEGGLLNNPRELNVNDVEELYREAL